MSDTLSSIRRARKAADSAARRALRHKMNPYNRLSNSSHATESEYDSLAARTTQDVISETLDIAHNRKNGTAGGRFSGLSTSVDKLFQDASIVQPEVRTLWQQKIGMHSMLTDDIRAKLVCMSHSNLREARLNDLAKWMVWMWCDAEGYDPEKHPRK